MGSGSGKLTGAELEALAPVLAALATMIGRHGAVDDGDLDLLLLGVDVPSAEVKAELARWATILAACRGELTVKTRQMAEQALGLRGLSEAQIILAIDAVCRAAAESAPAASPDPAFTGWTVTPEGVNFGRLAPKQGAIATLQINGPAGEAVGEPSSRVKVIPARFPAGETTLTVQVSGGSAGSLIWGSVFLRQGSHEQEVPVSAEWLVSAEPEPVAPEPAPPAPLTILFVGAPGSAARRACEWRVATRPIRPSMMATRGSVASRLLDALLSVTVSLCAVGNWMGSRRRRCAGGRCCTLMRQCGGSHAVSTR